jgi:head-tail adaptor
MRREPITYRVPTASTDAGKGVTYTYANGDLDWAIVEDVSDDYQTNTSQPMQGSSKRFKVRYRASLTVTDKYKILYQSKEYKVSTIVRKGEELIIKAKALV